MSEQDPLHVDPFELLPRNYADHIVQFNRSNHRRIAAEIENAFRGVPDGFCIATTGSDARHEKGPMSLVEIVLFLEKYSHTGEVVEKLHDFVLSDKHTRFEDQVEIKDVEAGDLSYVKPGAVGNRSQLTSPNRVFDASYLYGAEYLFKKAKSRVVEEVRANRNIFDRIKRKTKEHKDITRTGIQKFGDQVLSHYDLDAGVAHYRPDEYCNSFKQGPLRLVQYMLVRGQIRALRGKAPTEWLLELPTNTVEKLHFLEVEGHTTLGHSALSEVTDLYKSFLWLYHKSQQNSREGNPCLEFDSSEVRDMCRTLVHICDDPIVEYDGRHLKF